jgi:beta-galactosidase
MNDFKPDALREPNNALYLNTEFAGHMFPTKHFDNVERVQEHVRRHAHIHHLLGEDDQYAGGIGWCAFDYNTHADFGSGDRICYHGVADIFRIPKPAAGLYKSQCDPAEEIVLEPAFHWAIGDRSGGGGPGRGIVCSNCDHLKVYVNDELKAEADPDRAQFGGLPHPPFVVELKGQWGQHWHDLRIDGYLGGKKVASRTLSAAGVDRRFHLEPDDTVLVGDGIDATRMVLRVTDEYGNPRPFATGAIQLSLDGPGEIVGENPFALAGGVGAVWVKTKERAGTVTVTATHPYLGSQTVLIQVSDAPSSPL